MRYGIGTKNQNQKKNRSCKMVLGLLDSFFTTYQRGVCKKKTNPKLSSKKSPCLPKNPPPIREIVVWSNVTPCRYNKTFNSSNKFQFPLFNNIFIFNDTSGVVTTLVLTTSFQKFINHSHIQLSHKRFCRFLV